MSHDSTEDFLQSLPEIKPGERFWFACHPGVPCFNACCSDLTMPLTPYDVLRLRQGLGHAPAAGEDPSGDTPPLSSEEFFEEFATVGCYEDTGFPLLHLRMEDSPDRFCPFVTEAGCGVYANRSTACRMYPLGRATRPAERQGCRSCAAGGAELHGAGTSCATSEDNAVSLQAASPRCAPDNPAAASQDPGMTGVPLSEKFFLVREGHCKGFAESRAWTTADWLADQGLEPYNRMNDRYMRLIARYKALAKGAVLSGRHATMALLCLYQQDRFLEFLSSVNLFSRLTFTGAFAALSREEQIRRIMTHEEDRLWFAFAWMELVLFGSAEGLEPVAK